MPDITKDQLDQKLTEILAPFKEELERRDAEEKKHSEALGDTAQKVEDLAEKVSALASMKSQIEVVEARLNSQDVEETPQSKSEEDLLNSKEYKEIFWKMKMGGEGVKLTPTEEKVLSNAIDTTAGYLRTPPEFIREIIKPIDEYSPIRAMAKVRTVSASSTQQPVRTGTFSATAVAEQGTRSETTGLAYGLKEIPVNEWYARVVVTRQQMQDSAFDMPGVIAEEARMQFIVAEGSDFTNGAGTPGVAEGFMTNESVGHVASGHATTIDSLDPFINCAHSVKSGYWPNCVWVARRASIGTLRTLKNGVGDYLWEVSNQLSNPNEFLGSKMVEVPDMPAIASGAFPFAFGDFSQAYMIVDRTDLDIMRDPYSSKNTGGIEFDVYRRWGGKVIQSEALYKLEIAVS